MAEKPEALVVVGVSAERVRPPKSEKADTEQVRLEIERAREQLAQSAVALRDEVAAAVDWREWVGERPWTFVLGAVAVGFILGSRR